MTNKPHDSKIPRFRAAALLIAVSLCLCFTSACSMSGADAVIAGSSSIQPYAELLKHEFELQNPSKKIDVQGGGSTAGISSAFEGIADIGMSSRDLKPAELEKQLSCTVIAKDGLAIIIHPDNPIKKILGKNHIVDLSLDQIRGIYTGTIKNWSELGGEQADIHVFTREAGSGTRSTFEKYALDSENSGKFISSKANVLNSNGLIRMAVSDDYKAIGFISLGLVKIEPKPGHSPVKPVEAIRIDSTDATEDNVSSGLYPLARSLYFVHKGEPKGVAKEFLDFVLSEAGQEILSRAGLVAVGEMEAGA